MTRCGDQGWMRPGELTGAQSPGDAMIRWASVMGVFRQTRLQRKPGRFYPTTPDTTSLA
jgi:hypothetical protein